MKILITKKQYGALVDLLYLADWVLHAHDVEDRPESRPYRELVQALLSNAREMQAEELVESFEETLMPSRVVEDRVRRIIVAYDETSMWEELIATLGQRDAVRAMGEEGLKNLPEEEQIEVLLNYEEPWAKESEDHGLSRIVVDNALRS